MNPTNPNTQPPADRRKGLVHGLLGILSVRLSQQPEKTSVDTDGIINGVRPLQPPAASVENALPMGLGGEAVDSAITMKGGMLGVHPEVAPATEQEPVSAGFTFGPAPLPAPKPVTPGTLAAGEIIGGGTMPTQPAQVIPAPSMAPAGGLLPLKHEEGTPVHSLPTTWPSGQPPHMPRQGELPYVGPAPAHEGTDAPIPAAL